MATKLHRAIKHHLARFDAPDLVQVMKHRLLRHGIRHRGHFIVPLSALDRMMGEALHNVLAQLAHYRRRQRVEQERLRQRRNLSTK